MNKIKISLLSILLIIFFGIIFFIGQNMAQQKITESNNENLSNTLEPATELAISKTKEKRIVEESDEQSVEQALQDADKAIKEIEKEFMEEAHEEEKLAELLNDETEEMLFTDLWQINEKSSAELIETFKLPQSLKRVQGVTMKLNELDRVLVGDKIELPNINGTDYTATVDNIQQLKSGDLSVQAHIMAYGTDYPLRITRGQTITFANITTPRGNYQLQIKPNGEGVIIPENELDKLIDINKPDTIIPPTHKNFKENKTLDSQS